MASNDKDIKSRKASAWRVFYNMKKIWRSKMSRKLKMWQIHCLSRVLLLHGSESRTVTATAEGTLNGCHTLMKHMTHDQLRVSWQPTESLRQDESQKTGNSWTLHKTLITICKSTYPLRTHTRQGHKWNEVLIYWYAEVGHRICKLRTGKLDR
jgi:hypothetical protein